MTASLPAFTRTLRHFVEIALPEAAAYEKAELDLSSAYLQHRDLSLCSRQAVDARRIAGNLAVAIDGLADRAALDLGGSTTRAQAIQLVSPSVTFGPGGLDRPDCLKRITGTAVVRRHAIAKDPKVLIKSEDDVLAVGLGYGLDAYGVGKDGGPEVLVQDAAGQKWKFLGDAYCALSGWAQFLSSRGVPLNVHLPEAVLGRPLL